VEEPKSDASRLLRLLGVSFGVAVTVGGTIGVGILRTPGLVAAQLPYLWAIVAVWILGGLYRRFLGPTAEPQEST